MIKNVFILHNPKIKGIEKERTKVEGILKRYGAVVEDSPEDVDLIITMGGDGTFLKGVHLTKDINTFVYGIKYGKVGFLTHSSDDIEENLKKVLIGKFKTSKRILLEISIRKGNKILKDFCLNEIVVFRKGIRIIDISVLSKNEEIFSRLRCDGVIVSTPTGSTAHSLSAYGPVISPDTKCLLIVPVAPHTLCWRPVIIPSDETISIDVSPDALIAIDGQREIQVSTSDKIVIKKSKKRVNIIIDDTAFFSKLKSKFHWGS
ncbi:MAG: NAD(+)/NADH kinase [bacterium]|nr:NAD(+)/NADH kinase [bacterium]